MIANNIYIIAYTQTLFYDGHGEGDNGGLKKEVFCIQNGDWLKKSMFVDQNDNPYVPGKEYNNDGISRENDTSEYHSEDGYTKEVNWTSIKIITLEQFEEYSKIIDLYNSI